MAAFLPARSAEHGCSEPALPLQVMESWRKVLKNVRPRAFQIQLQDVRIYATETYGYVTCVEVIDADDSKGRIAATNVFEVQDGRWVITHHHGAPTRLSF
jgi:translation initiation factor 2A